MTERYRDIYTDAGLVNEEIRCIKMVAKFLQSDNSEVRQEGKRIRKNIIDSMKIKKEDYSHGFDFLYNNANPKILNPDRKELNLEHYVKKLEKEEDLDLIQEELSKGFYLEYSFVNRNYKK